MSGPLLNDSELRAAARFYLDQLELHPEDLSSARARVVKAARSLDRASRVHSLLALFCGENTARSAIEASARRHKVQPNQDLPAPLLRDLSRIATELCGRPVGQLIWEMGQ
jgi:hypothetical protein